MARGGKSLKQLKSDTNLFASIWGYVRNFGVKNLGDDLSREARLLADVLGKADSMKSCRHQGFSDTIKSFRKKKAKLRKKLKGAKASKRKNLNAQIKCLDREISIATISRRKLRK